MGIQDTHTRARGRGRNRRPKASAAECCERQGIIGTTYTRLRRSCRIENRLPRGRGGGETVTATRELFSGSAAPGGRRARAGAGGPRGGQPHTRGARDGQPRTVYTPTVSERGDPPHSTLPIHICTYPLYFFCPVTGADSVEAGLNSRQRQGAQAAATAGGGGGRGQGPSWRTSAAVSPRLGRLGEETPGATGKGWGGGGRGRERATRPPVATGRRRPHTV